MPTRRKQTAQAKPVADVSVDAPDRLRPAPDAAALNPAAIVDHLDVGVISTDMSGLIRTWNPAAERLYGWPAGEVVGRHVSLLTVPEDLPTWHATIVEPTLAVGVNAMQRRHRCKDGREIRVSLRLSVQRDAAGEPIGVIGCVNDITARERVADELRRQREEQEIILDAMPAMVWYKDRDNRIVRANRAAAASVQKTTEEISGQSTYDLYPEEAADYYRDDLEVMRSGLPKLGIVEPIQTASGEKRWVRTDKIPHRNERGEIDGVIVFAVDISDHKRAEAALEQARAELEERVRERTAELSQAVETLRAEVDERLQAEERLALALWATDLGLWDWDLRTNRVVSDQRSAEMLGYGLDEIGADLQSWQHLLHPEDRLDSERALAEHLRAHRAAHFEMEHRMRTRQGEYRWILTRGKVVDWTADGRARRIAGTHRDITDRKQIEEQMRRQQAELAHVLRLQTVEGVAAELAHEINQPLGAIANFANGLAARLRQGGSDRGAMLEAAEQIAKQALRAAQVLQRLRDFTRRRLPQRARCDLNTLVRDAADFIEPDLRRHRIALRLRLDAALAAVNVDSVQVEQVVLNLARNGVESIADGGAGGELTIETAATADGDAQVTVHDTGAGIAPAAAEQLFDPFFTTKTGGLGMGLSISRSIIEAHGGRLFVVPSAGRGATFGFSLPVSDPAS